MKMSIGDDFYQGIYFSEDEKYGQFDVPDDVAHKWLSAEKEYEDARDEARSYL